MKCLITAIDPQLKIELAGNNKMKMKGDSELTDKVK